MLTTLLDKAEFPIPAHGLSPFLGEVVAELRAENPQIKFSRTKNYAALVDLRQFDAGMDAMLHVQSKATGRHKLELLECGHKSKGQMLSIVERAAKDHPALLEVSRVDACADVENVSVDWFGRSVLAELKRWNAQFGKIHFEDGEGRTVQFSSMGMKKTETIYMGKQPNCYRVYDKRAERWRRYQFELRKFNKAAAAFLAGEIVADAHGESAWLTAPREWRRAFAKRLRGSAERMHSESFPSFEQWFADQCTGGMTGLVQMELPGAESPEQLTLVPRIPRVLTRVERQMASGKVPEQLNTVEKLFRYSPEFNPFARLQFSPARGSRVVDLDTLTPVEYAAGRMFEQWLRTGEMTYQQLCAFLQMGRGGRRGGNRKRLLDKFRPFLAEEVEGSANITPADLYERYRDTVTRQLAA